MAQALLLSLASQAASATPLISVVIDDLGDQRSRGERALQLPGAVAYAFLPNTRFADEQARRAHQSGKEVLLHLPLQPSSGELYETGISSMSNRQHVAQQLKAGLASVPHASGVNNHQGSLLTRSLPHMQWLMDELRRAGDYYFLDSRTTGGSVAYQAARARGLAATTRNIFLDTERDGAYVAEQFHKLVVKAKRHGHALAIGHPYPETLRVLERELQRLDQHGVALVAPSALISAQGRGADTAKNYAAIEALRLSTTPSFPLTRTTR